MRHFIILIIAISLGVYHIKNTNYDLTVYLLQFLAAILIFKALQRVKKRKEESRDD